LAAGKGAGHFPVAEAAMRRKKFLLLSSILYAVLFLGNSQAAVLLDTGPGPSSGSAWYLDSIHRGVAGKFTTTRTWTIGSVETWMQVDAGGPVRAAIYNHDAGGDLPGSVRFSQNFTATANPVAGWQGVSGLNWSLPPGTYWVGLQVETIGIQGVMYSPAAHPLGRYAFFVLDNPWSQFYVDLGFRIQGNGQVIPPLNGIYLLLSD
jgi:hypothetical protein